jgi:hypothetical protein
MVLYERKERERYRVVWYGRFVGRCMSLFGHDAIAGDSRVFSVRKTGCPLLAYVQPVPATAAYTNPPLCTSVSVAPGRRIGRWR